MKSEPDESEIGTGEETKAELIISNYLGTVIHLFSCGAAFDRCWDRDS